MVKTLENVLLRNQESFGAESWYIASGTQALPSQVCSNNDHRLTFDLFMGMGVGKLKNHFFQYVFKTNG